MIKARARRTDPATSHDAAREVEQSGTAGTQRQACRDEVYQKKGRTSAEIAEESGMDRYAVARRLGEMRNDEDPPVWAPEDRARKCRIMGRRALTWWPIEDKPVPDEPFKQLDLFDSRGIAG